MMVALCLVVLLMAVGATLRASRIGGSRLVISFSLVAQVLTLVLLSNILRGE